MEKEAGGKLMKFDYFYGIEADQYSFVRIPKILVTEAQFVNISIHAKVLYGLLLDRMGMAIKNEWLDDKNRMYVIYPIDEIIKDMGVGRKKAMDCLAELESVGLVHKKTRRNGLPSLLYVKDFVVA